MMKKARLTGPETTVTHGASRAPDKSFRLSLFELGGALGDLGTLLPLSIALITLNHMSATSVFSVLGLAYVMVGLVYRLPVPVQPLKAVAAIAIAGNLSASVISASGLVMAAFLLLLAWTGATGRIAKLFPKAIIRGLQLGVGLILVRAGLALVNKQQVIVGGGDESVAIANLSIPSSWLLALALGGVFVLFLRSKRVPASVVLLGLGGLAGILWGSTIALPSLRFGLSLPSVTAPGLGDIYAALILLVIPQIPLTLGNSVFATLDTARAYFGPRAVRVTPRALLTTMGVANLGAGLLGGMPVCHGSGGLTAHFRLGARTGGAALLLGATFLALALLLDGNVLPILSLVPYPALGVLVVFVGVQHSLLVRDLRGKEEISIATVLAVVGLITSNLAIGFASGLGLLALRGLLRGRRVAFRLTGETSAVSSLRKESP